MFLPENLFQYIDTIISPIIWNKSPPRFARAFLQATPEDGGLAYSNFSVFSRFSAYVQYVYDWLYSDTPNPSTTLMVALGGASWCLTDKICRSVTNHRDKFSPEDVNYLNWIAGKNILSPVIQYITPCGPLCCNRKFKDLYGHPDAP